VVDEFKIEPDVPMPQNTHKAKYPFANMNAGDSFSFDKSLLNSVRNNSQSYGKRHGSKFVCRQIGTDVWRCWRVE
jgi:hypothetical protein